MAFTIFILFVDLTEDDLVLKLIFKLIKVNFNKLCTDSRVPE